MPFSVQHVSAVVGQETVSFVQPILHTHELLVLRHHLGVVDEHGHQPVQAGQLLFVQVVLRHQRVAFENFPSGAPFQVVSPIVGLSGVARSEISSAAVLPVTA